MKETKDDYRIVVLQRGWVIVGRYSEKGDRGYLDGALVIRRWVTEKSLGQLVNGPITEGKYSPTVLDKCHGRVEFLLSTIVLILNAEADKWAPHCS